MRNVGKSKKVSPGTALPIICGAGIVTTPDAVCVGKVVLLIKFGSSIATRAICGTRFSASVSNVSTRPLKGVITIGPNFHWMGHLKR